MDQEIFEPNSIPDIPFDDIIAALLDVNTPFNPRYLYRLSDLAREDLQKLRAAWPDVPDWRRQALMEDVEELGEANTILSFEELARFAIRDENPKVRMNAVRTLMEFEAKDLIPVFIDMLEQDPDVQVRAAAATALGYYVYLGELEELAEDLQQEVEYSLLTATNTADTQLVRRRALESLGFSGRQEVPLLIEAAYNSGDKDLMMSALFAMGRSANERWQPQVVAMLESQFPGIRMEAARAAGELEIHEAVPRLLDLLDDPNVEVRLASVWSLSQLGGMGVSEALEDLYEESDDEEEAAFIETALENLAFTEGVQAFELFDLPDGAEGDLDDDLDDELFDLIDEDEDEEFTD